MITKKQAEKKGIIPFKVEIELWIDPATKNVYYPCDADDNLYDRFIYLTDPAVDPTKPFNMLCKDHKLKWQRNSVGLKVLSLVEAGAKIYLDGQWQKLTKKLLDKLNEKSMFIIDTD